MREIKEFTSSSYSNLKSKIEHFVSSLSDDKIIEAITMMCDSNTSSSNKYVAIIVIK